MTGPKKLQVLYSQQSIQNAKEIVAYLKSRFSNKEVVNFYQSLSNFEKVISAYPTLYSESKKMKFRRAVLSKVLSVYYTFNQTEIVIIAIFDNRWQEEGRIE
jgi:hypothetical protein